MRAHSHLACRSQAHRGLLVATREASRPWRSALMTQGLEVPSAAATEGIRDTPASDQQQVAAAEFGCTDAQYCMGGRTTWHSSKQLAPMQMDLLTLGMLNAMGANISRGRGTGIHAYTGSTGPLVRLEGDGPPPPMRPPSPAPTDDDLEMQEAIRMSLATVAAAATDVRGTACAAAAAHVLGCRPTVCHKVFSECAVL